MCINTRREPNDFLEHTGKWANTYQVFNNKKKSIKVDLRNFRIFYSSSIYDSYYELSVKK